MSRGLFAHLAGQTGLSVERQFDSWGASDEFDLAAYADAFTVLRRS
jgi:hypothetical protein